MHTLCFYRYCSTFFQKQITINKYKFWGTCGGSSSVLFAYSFLLLFGRFDNIYKVEQDSLYFFLEGGFKGIYLREKNFTLSYVVSEI